MMHRECPRDTDDITEYAKNDHNIIGIGKAEDTMSDDNSLQNSSDEDEEERGSEPSDGGGFGEDDEEW